MANSACDQVFQTYELARLILSEITSGHDLLNTMRTCKVLHAHVKDIVREYTLGSRTARKVLGAGDKQNNFAILNPFLDLCFDRFEKSSVRSTFPLFVIPEKNPEHAILFPPDLEQLHHAPWRQFATRPPVQTVQILRYEIPNEALSFDTIADIDYLTRCRNKRNNRIGQSDEQIWGTEITTTVETGVTIYKLWAAVYQQHPRDNSLIMVIPGADEAMLQKAKGEFEAVVKEIEGDAEIASVAHESRRDYH